MLGTISVFLLGMFCNTQPNAAANPLNCGEVAGQGLTPSRPAAASGVQGGAIILELFIRGTDNRVYWNHSADVTGFNGWTEVPLFLFQFHFETISAPSAILFNGLVRLFARGTDNRIYENDFDGTNWSFWSEIPGNGLTLSGPVAVDVNGVLELLIRGLDNRIYTNILNNSNNTWGSWRNFFGEAFTISEPAAIVIPSPFFAAYFMRGEDNRIYENNLNGSGWYEVPGGGLTIAGPSVLRHNGIIKLFITGTDDGIWENDFVGGNWSGWSEVLGGGFTPSGPAAVETFPGTSFAFSEVYVSGEDGRIFECN